MNDFIVTAICDAGHKTTMRYRGMTRPEVEMHAQLLDGSSPLYVYPPQPGDGGFIGKCCWTDDNGTCGKPFKCTVEEIQNGKATAEEAPPIHPAESSWPLEQDEDYPRPLDIEPRFPQDVPWPEHRCLYCKIPGKVIVHYNGGPSVSARCGYCGKEWELL